MQQEHGRPTTGHVVCDPDTVDRGDAAPICASHAIGLSHLVVKRKAVFCGELLETLCLTGSVPGDGVLRKKTK